MELIPWDKAALDGSLESLSHDTVNEEWPSTQYKAIPLFNPLILCAKLIYVLSERAS